MKLTIVTPAFNEEENLPVLHEALVRILGQAEIDFEWIVVDDCSTDGTFDVIQSLAERDDRVKGVRFSRNFGSHQAIRCGLDRSAGDAVIVLAADMQDPPDVIPSLIERMNQGADIVWAVRGSREGERRRTTAAANLFYRIVRKTTDLNQPPTGADFFLLHRKVVDALGQCRENNVNILCLISWLGFQQAEVVYTKKARLYGSSGWTLRKKLNLAIDSIVSFSSVPLRCMSLLGFATAFSGLLYALFIIVSTFFGHPIQGWPSLMVVILISSGILMMMSGALGEYLWRTLDETKGRPGYVVDKKTPEKPEN